MNFKEWLETLTPKREHTAGEDIADSIALAVICVLLMCVVFI